MTDAPALRVREVRVYLRRVRTRMPFRYGKAVLTEMPVAHVRVRIEDRRGEAAVGVSACALPPLWFDKDDSKTHERQIRDLLFSLRVAADLFLGAPLSRAYELHREVEPEARRRLPGLNDLTAGFGVALMDAAVIDAVCRSTGATFHQALKGDILGFGELPVAERPLPRMQVRHTVGLADPIIPEDLAEPVGDGLPETLEEVVFRYRVRWFKIKIARDGSLERLRKIATVVDRWAPDYHITLDGNEQFPSMAEFGDVVRRIADERALRNFWKSTLWIEQPLERHAALDADLGELGRLKPVIIDESDGTDEAVDRALALGYGGVSAKNCKGVYRTLHSFAATRRAGAILSSEDLVNQPVVPLHQDLCVAAALRIPHSERNGHHYFAGFAFLSPREQEAALREYPSMYRARPDGPAALRIEEGALALDEINDFGFGVRSEPDWDSLDPVDLSLIR